MAKGNLRNVEGVKRGDLYTMNPLDIKVVWKDNPRFDYGTDEEWNELKNSIKNEGVKNPVQVYVDKRTKEIYLAQGYRRMKAVLELLNEGVDLTSIKVEQIEFNEEAILQNHYTQNNTGKPLSDLEMSELLSRVKKLSGGTPQEIAKRFGMDAQKVTKLINYVSEASSLNKKMVRQKEISLANAMAVAKQANGIREQNAILNKAAQEMKKSGAKKIKPIHLVKSGVVSKTSVASAISRANSDSSLETLKRAIAYASTSQEEDIDIEFVERVEKVVDAVEKEMAPEELAQYFTKVQAEV